MEKIGQRIKTLRLSKGLTQQDLCGDESHLTIRQLIRIEKGESKPSLERLAYLAQQLGIHTYELMGDYQELPQRYLSLKNWILRHDDYGSEDIKIAQERYFDEIFENFYDDLPRDEQFAIDCMFALNQVRLTNDVSYAVALLEENIEIVNHKDRFQTNDLLFIGLLVRTKQVAIETDTVLSLVCDTVIEEIATILFHQDYFVVLTDLFIVRDTIISILSYFDTIEQYHFYKQGIDVLTDLMVKTHDFQKKAIVFMLEWKYLLFQQQQFESAHQKYNDAKTFASFLDIPSLLVGFDMEWKKDMQKFYLL